MNYKSKMNFCVSLFLVAILPVATFAQSNKGHASSIQNNQTKSAMTKEDVLQMATLIKALKEEYGMIDQDPESDFLIFTRDDDELEFFPKRSLLKQMEAQGLLLNKGAKDPVREPSTHHEWDDETKSWKAITSQGWIIYLYEITEKGNEFLRNAPKTLGHAVPPLKIASEESVEKHTRTKTISTETYDQAALQKMHDDFVRASSDKIEAMFAYPGGQETAAVPDGIICGPKLWSRLEVEAIRNGIRKGELRIKEYHATNGGPSHSVEGVRPGSAISSQEQVRLFLKTLVQVFPLNDKVSIKALSEAEASNYREYWETMASAMSPAFTPFMATAAFSVEYGSIRLVVKIRNDSGYDFMKLNPKISSIEIIENR